jgi:hypothetical protein
MRSSLRAVGGRTASSFLPPSRIQNSICSTSERPELAAAVRAACRRPSHRVAVFGRVARMRSSPAPSLRPGTDTLLPLITWEGTSDLESYLRGQETRIHAESVSSDSTSWLGSTSITYSQARVRVMCTSWKPISSASTSSRGAPSHSNVTRIKSVEAKVPPRRRLDRTLARGRRWRALLPEVRREYRFGTDVRAWRPPESGRGWTLGPTRAACAYAPARPRPSPTATAGASARRGAASARRAAGARRRRGRSAGRAGARRAPRRGL